MYLKKRIETLRETLVEKGLNGLILIDAEGAGWENAFYYSGFQGSNCLVAVTATRALLVTDSRYLSQASQQSPLELRTQTLGQSLTDVAEQIVKELVIKRCGFDGGALCAASYLKIASLPVEWVDFSDAMSRQRRHKDSHEIALICNAADIATKAYLKVLGQVTEGMKEIEFAKLTELEIARLGGQGVWHNSSMIVASGARSALPHGRASDKAMVLGEQVTVDYGAIYGAYMSDLTRNFSLGPVKDREFLEIHQILLKAHNDAAAMLAPGVRGCDVDAVARKIIADAGYGQYFGHGLGHSFGLEIHESPRLAPSYTEPLEIGDVITVEPGIYIPDRGGLRLEDDYLITENGAVRISSKLPQEFAVVAL